MDTQLAGQPGRSTGGGHNLLGDFLRSRRVRLDPASVGIVDRGRRRTSGLRREEVAELAGISVDWYARLEQGRGTRPSTATIAALARALRLDETEHGHLLALCGGLRLPPFQRETVPESLARVVHGFEQPAYVTGLRWDVLAWNAGAHDLFGFGDMAPDDRNMVIYALTNPAARRLFASDWAEQAKRILAKFRVTYDLWASDAAFEALTARLHRDCPHFAPWWNSHDVRGAAGSRKTLHLPDASRVRFDFTTFQATDDPAMQLVVLVPLSVPRSDGGTRDPGMT